MTAAQSHPSGFASKEGTLKMKMKMYLDLSEYRFHQLTFVATNDTNYLLKSEAQSILIEILSTIHRFCLSVPSQSKIIIKKP